MECGESFYVINSDSIFLFSLLPSLESKVHLLIPDTNLEKPPDGLCYAWCRKTCPRETHDTADLWHRPGLPLAQKQIGHPFASPRHGQHRQTEKFVLAPRGRRENRGGRDRVCGGGGVVLALRPEARPGRHAGRRRARQGTPAPAAAEAAAGARRKQQCTSGMRKVWRKSEKDDPFDVQAFRGIEIMVTTGACWAVRCVDSVHLSDSSPIMVSVSGCSHATQPLA